MRSRRIKVGPVEVELRLKRVGEPGPVQPGGLQVVPTPVFTPLKRSAQRALDHLRAARLAGDGTKPNPEAQAFLAESRRKREEATTLQEKIDTLGWYHTVDLGNGVMTPGGHDHRALVQHLGFPASLAGKRALDVATFDGFWSFELEKLGAEVTSVDLPNVREMDWPTGAREILVNEQLDVTMGESYAIAKEARGSSVTRVPCSVYDLSPEKVGTFDFVFMGDLLLHLEEPLRALRAVRSVTKGRIVMVDRYDAELTGTGKQLIRYEGGWHGLEWYAPSLETLVQWVVDAGFEDVKIHTTYTIDGGNKAIQGWHRAAIHATGG